MEASGSQKWWRGVDPSWGVWWTPARESSTEPPGVRPVPEPWRSVQAISATWWVKRLMQRLFAQFGHLLGNVVKVQAFQLWLKPFKFLFVNSEFLFLWKQFSVVSIRETFFKLKHKLNKLKNVKAYKNKSWCSVFFFPGSGQTSLPSRLLGEDDEDPSLLLLLLLEDARQPEQPEDQGNHYEEQRPAEKENGPRLRSMQR